MEIFFCSAFELRVWFEILFLIFFSLFFFFFSSFFRLMPRLTLRRTMAREKWLLGVYTESLFYAAFVSSSQRQLPFVRSACTDTLSISRIALSCPGLPILAIWIGKTGTSSSFSSAQRLKTSPVFTCSLHSSIKVVVVPSIVVIPRTASTWAASWAPCKCADTRTGSARAVSFASRESRASHGESDSRPCTCTWAWACTCERDHLETSELSPPQTYERAEKLFAKHRDFDFLLALDQKQR